MHLWWFLAFLSGTISVSAQSVDTGKIDRLTCPYVEAPGKNCNFF